VALLAGGDQLVAAHLLLAELVAAVVRLEVAVVALFVRLERGVTAGGRRAQVEAGPVERAARDPARQDVVLRAAAGAQRLGRGLVAADDHAAGRVGPELVALEAVAQDE